MNKQNKSKNKRILLWIHRNRVKLGIWLFLIILPVTLVVTAYVGSYTTNKSVYFDSEITEESIKISDFIEADELKGITLTIEWDALKRPVESDDGSLQEGYYRFIMSYAPNRNYEIGNVKITPVLQTDWKNYRSVGIQRYLSTNNIAFLVDFNFDLPKSPLLFVTIEDPNLYLKVEYTYTVVGEDVTQIEYVKFSLKDLNPATVIPNS
ncbi:hypothetical protein [Mariniplasma anaerobium]|uniref:Uncharacterized protein n=1 Tax=Mariniplasma anaerobium TaxID=2735436 RepID=A0A7U9TGI8_9MOLU|nr:hypothetical protein [Mariniplasma anaerobium]BCR35658.1 hypothetical protein MPAN_005510 [Mariniplasma anaerobium]